MIFIFPRVKEYKTIHDELTTYLLPELNKINTGMI